MSLAFYRLSGYSAWKPVWTHRPASVIVEKTPEFGEDSMRAGVLIPAAVSLILFTANAALAEPATTPAPKGIISGSVTNPERCLGVQLLCRTGHHPLRPKVLRADYNRKTGEFRVTGLPDEVYDLRLLIKGGRIDGADMRLPPQDPSILIPPFTPEDEKAIREVVAHQPKSFMNIHRVVFAKGCCTDAKAVVESIRCHVFHSGKKGDIIWRVDVWTFQKQTGAWVKLSNRPVLARIQAPREMPVEKFEKLVWLFDGNIGGLEIINGSAIEGLSVTVPAPDANRGKVVGSVRRQVEEFKKKQAEQE